MEGNIVTETIKLCAWSEAKFLIFSENVFAPLIYYSHLGTLIIVAFFGLFIFINNKKGLTNKILFYLTCAISAWLFSDLVLWATDRPELSMFFWSLEIILEPLIYVFALRFFYVFIDKQENLKAKIISYTLLIPTFLLAPTSLALTGFNLTNCDRVAIEGILPKYGYFVEIIIVLWVVLLAFDRYRKNKEWSTRKQIIFTALGICLFLFSFSLGNIAEVITENWYIGQIGYIGIPVFLGILSYQIVRFKAFNIKIIGSEVLVTSIWFLIVSILFVRTVENARVVVSLTLMLFTILGIYLIRSVKREVEQREKIELLAKDLEFANSKLTDLDQMKSEFLSLASHQMRAPLTAMKGYTSMLIEGEFGTLPPKAEESVKVIMRSNQNLINIVNDFLNISRIEQGKMIYEKTVFKIKDLVKEVVEEHKLNIEKGKLSIKVEIPNNFESEVNADRDKIRQVIGNIIDNSVKYTINGGITVSLHSDSEKVMIKIKDTGIGIDPSEVGKLFNKFSRSKSANKTNVIGTGLGLYIAQKMAEDQGGKIKVFSEGEGKGSTFTIELPKAKA